MCPGAAGSGSYYGIDLSDPRDGGMCAGGWGVVCVCVKTELCVRACVRACVHACMRVGAWVRGCVRVRGFVGVQARKKRQRCDRKSPLKCESGSMCVCVCVCACA